LSRAECRRPRGRQRKGCLCGARSARVAYLRVGWTEGCSDVDTSSTERTLRGESTNSPSPPTHRLARRGGARNHPREGACHRLSPFRITGARIKVLVAPTYAEGALPKSPVRGCGAPNDFICCSTRGRGLFMCFSSRVRNNALWNLGVCSEERLANL